MEPKQQPPYPLRMPDEMRSHLEDEAELARRSLNAHIVATLQDVQRMRDEVERLGRQLVEEKAQIARLEQLASQRGDTLYIILDSHGYPISWAEINTYLAALREGGGGSPSSVHVTVLTPDMESSSRRAEQVVELAKRLRSKGKSKVVLPKGQEVDGPRKVLVVGNVGRDQPTYLEKVLRIVGRDNVGIDGKLEKPANPTPRGPTPRKRKP